MSPLVGTEPDDVNLEERTLKKLISIAGGAALLCVLGVCDSQAAIITPVFSVSPLNIGVNKASTLHLSFDVTPPSGESVSFLGALAIFDFGDGTVQSFTGSNSFNVSHTYVAAGTYTPGYKWQWNGTLSWTSTDVVGWTYIILPGPQGPPGSPPLADVRIPVPIYGDVTHTIPLTSFLSGSFAYGDAVTVTDSVAAVPEPSTWAMMLLGFAGLGWVAYRRKAAGLTVAAT